MRKRLIALIVLFCFLLLFFSFNTYAEKSENYITIFFADTLGWNDINVSFRNEGAAEKTSVKMTPFETNTDNVQVFTAQIPADVTGVFFENNDKRTSCISEVYDGGYWYPIDKLNIHGEYCLLHYSGFDFFTHEDGYYLIDAESILSDDHLFQNSLTGSNEYCLYTTLLESQIIEIVYVQNDQMLAWYPEESYVVDSAHSGEVIIYFTDEYKSEWSEFGGYMFIDKVDSTGSTSEEITFLSGDADGDGTVTVIDVSIIQQYLAKMNPENMDIKASDVDGDGNITIVDATIIQQYLAKIPIEYKVGEMIT